MEASCELPTLPTSEPAFMMTNPHVQAAIQQKQSQDVP